MSLELSVVPERREYEELNLTGLEPACSIFFPRSHCSAAIRCFLNCLIIVKISFVCDNISTNVVGIIIICCSHNSSTGIICWGYPKNYHWGCFCRLNWRKKTLFHPQDGSGKETGTLVQKWGMTCFS